jgi:hypothetical protein
LFFLNVFDVSNGIIESSLGEVACLSWVVQALIVEDAEVEGQSQSDGVGCLEFSVRDFGGLGISIEGSAGDLFVSISHSVFRDISVVITLHF